MLYYFAPLEGITTAIFRRAHHRHFPGVAQYFTPFLSPTRDRVFTPREQREILPQYNAGIPVVPQLLTRNADDFLWAAGELAAMGYREVNLNLGCPSGTVVAKGKGAGLLADPAALDCFLDRIYAAAPLQISLKTRLGIRAEEEFDALLAVYNRYPVKCLTIHPRVQKDFYNGTVRLAAFDRAVAASRNPLCYNGDITTRAQLAAFPTRYPAVEAVMLGRGLAANPALLTPAGVPERAALRRFHDELFDGYRAAYGCDRNAVLRMKDLWRYLLCLFDGGEKQGKLLRKAVSVSEYLFAVEDIFARLPIRCDVQAAW